MCAVHVWDTPPGGYPCSCGAEFEACKAAGNVSVCICMDDAATCGLQHQVDRQHPENCQQFVEKMQADCDPKTSPCLLLGGALCRNKPHCYDEQRACAARLFECTRWSTACSCSQVALKCLWSHSCAEHVPGLCARAKNDWGCPVDCSPPQPPAQCASAYEACRAGPQGARTTACACATELSECLDKSESQQLLREPPRGSVYDRACRDADCYVAGCRLLPDASGGAPLLPLLPRNALAAALAALAALAAAP
eukprot:m51a1_g14136 hypothetical protein (252) ;mRNA; r:235958-237040